MESQILAKVIRGETVESVHRGHLIAIDGGGEVRLSVGDPQTVTFFRSASKPFQAVPSITSGATDSFGFSEDEIAMACASHSGESVHVEIVGRMLEKIGCGESDLRCGVHLPFNEKEAERLLRANETITQIHNNCSGKHAAMLAFAKHINADIDRYDQPQSPVQQAILKTISIFCELPKEDVAIGIDGCCVPNFAIPMVSMAQGFLNLVAPREGFQDETVRKAASRIVSAMLKYPELIGGSERIDTMLMQAAPGKLISKVGADGVWLCGVLPCGNYPKGLAIALKIEDGDDKRARPVVAVELLKQLGLLPASELSELSPILVRNRRTNVVGRVEALKALLTTNGIVSSLIK